jgi:TRAP transporter TAXI family solute receptor
MQHHEETAMPHHSNIFRRRLLAGAATTIAGIAIHAAAGAQGAPAKVTLAGGSVGGAWSAVGTAIGETLRKEYPGISFTYEPGREAGNLLLVSQGKVQLGIAHAQLARQAEAGIEPFTQPLKNVRAIAMIDPEAAVQILATTASGITSIDQIRERKMPVRVALNSKGTLMAVAGEAVFSAHGFSVKDIENWGGRLNYVAYNNGLAMMKNGQIDLIINMLAFPSSQIVNAARDTQFKLIGLGPEAIDRLNKQLGTETISVPASTYAFSPEAATTVRGSVVVMAAAEMKDGEAEAIVSAMLKHFEFLQKSHATLSRLTPESLTRVAPLPLHPGAAAAYRKAGLLK